MDSGSKEKTTTFSNVPGGNDFRVLICRIFGIHDLCKDLNPVQWRSLREKGINKRQAAIEQGNGVRLPFVYQTSMHAMLNTISRRK